MNGEETNQIIHIITELDRKTGSDKEIDYKSLYYHLFNGISDIIRNLSELQTEAEEMFIEQPPNT